MNDGSLRKSIKAGKLKALAVTGLQMRSEIL